MSAALLAPAPRPEQLAWWHLFFRPLLRIEQAAELLDDVHKRHVVALCEEGRLRAVNIAEKLGTRREIRVWLYSVQWLGEATRRRITAAPRHPEIATLLPHSRPNLLLREVGHFLQCDERHVRNLPLDGPAISTRQNRVARPALIDFLATREIL